MKQRIQELLLPRVQKPSRYLGNEWNAVHKDWDQVPVKMAFAFPDVYEVGMSHLGLHILYGLVNQRDSTLLERVFAPGLDLESLLQEQGLPLFSLESYRPLGDFDLIGFTLQYEMSYTNILNMLHLGKIPLRSKDRGDSDPLIIAGGPGAFNPEPLAPFIDAFLLGDGEEALQEILDLAEKHKSSPGGRINRKLFLEEAVGIKGIYVPAFYQVSYTTEGKIKKIWTGKPWVPERVMRRVVADLDGAYFPTRPVVPYMETVHDRMLLEVQRGCTRGCRFCQAGVLYRPVRERRPDLLRRQAGELLAHTGYNEISLTSLSTADYSCIEFLSRDLLDTYGKEGVSISLPSLRVDAFSVNLAKELQRVRKSGLTFAPEAGTQRLRDVINKGVTENDLLEAVESAFEAGWTGIKLYFMLGLPTEKMEDLEGIAHLAEKVFFLGKTINSRHKRSKKIRITISVSSFVPKAHTPFQWEPQDPVSLLEEKQRYLRKLLPAGKINYSYHDASLSFLEAVFAKGDRRLAQVLELAWRKGCKFDSWREHFAYEKWLEAFQEIGLDPNFYANRPIDPEEILPWEHLNVGVTKEFLLEEREKALAGELTGDCRQGLCSSCGVCPQFQVDPVIQGGTGENADTFGV